MKIKNILNFKLNFKNPLLPIFSFIFLAIPFGIYCIYSYGGLSGPDLYQAHYAQTVLTSRGYFFNHTSKTENGAKYQIVSVPEKYINSNIEQCLDNQFVQTVLQEFISGDPKKYCISDLKDDNDHIVKANVNAQYPFLSYIPQASGMFIANILGFSVNTQIQFARFFNFMFYLFIVALSIYLIPRAKWLFVVLGLLPTSLFLASSLSADSITIAFAFLITAVVFRFRTYKTKLTLVQKNVLLFLFIPMFLLKFAYAPICLLIFLIPDKILNLKSKLIISTVSVIIGLILYIIFSYWTGLNVRSTIPSLHDNITYIIQHFGLAFLGILINVLYLPMLIIDNSTNRYLVLSIIIGAIIYKSNQHLFKKKLDTFYDLLKYYKPVIISLIVAMLSMGLTYAALMASFNDVRGNGFVFIDGFQGRYVLPILPLLASIYFIGQDYFPSRTNIKHSKSVKSNK